MTDMRWQSGMWPYVRVFGSTRAGRIAVGVTAAIAVSLALMQLDLSDLVAELPLMAAVLVVGVPLLIQVVKDAWHRRFGADLLGLLAMVTGAALGEWLVAGIIALMLSGGEALESAASLRASQVLQALASRSPKIAHRRDDAGGISDLPVSEVEIGDTLVLLPLEICPVDGVVLEGAGSMDEAYLTGEPYVVPKTPGATVMSGAINAEVALVVQAKHTAQDSRYAQIVGVLERAEEERPPIRRLADRLGAVYTVIALAFASAGWAISGEPERFLAVLVIATPCPLLIGIPVAVIGAISKAAQHGIIVKDPSMLERLSTARTMIFDKTGTLTYGRPTLSTVSVAQGFEREEVLQLVGSLERYSRHPLASAIAEAVQALPLENVERVAEKPGQGLVGSVNGHEITVTGRKALSRKKPEAMPLLPAEAAGLECVVLVDDLYAATLQFRDEPRTGARQFVEHLSPRHGIVRTILLSGDRASEVEYLAGRVGLDEAHASVSPEDKLSMVRAETALAPTVFLGDGINDAPAMTAATVGIAFGQDNEITAEAADAVVLDSSLDRLDELLHIGRRMRRIALQTAIGGIGLSAIGMVLAVLGLLPPIAGAVAQEVIDLVAILNATRVAFGSRPMADFRAGGAPYDRRSR